MKGEDGSDKVSDPVSAASDLAEDSPALQRGNGLFAGAADLGVARTAPGPVESSDCGCDLGFRGGEVVVGLVFDGWDVSYFTVEPAMAVPVDPFRGGQFDLGERSYCQILWMTGQPDGRSIKQAVCGSGRIRSAAGTPRSRRGRRTGVDLPCP